MIQEKIQGNLPLHVAIIMDGNGRWAKRRLLPRNAGHRAGAEALRKLSEKMNDAGFKNLTVFAFSTENWNRPDDEVRGLMSLMAENIQKYIDDSEKNNMRICVIGDLSKIDRELQDKIRYLMDLTKNNPGMRVNIAINYGGRDEIVRAVRKVARDITMGLIASNNLNEAAFATYLDTADMTDPELLIRTSGEVRLSNFMLWQIPYSEIYISDKLWPDFGYNDLIKAVEFYQNRDRRFGR